MSFRSSVNFGRVLTVAAIAMATFGATMGSAVGATSTPTTTCKQAKTTAIVTIRAKHDIDSEKLGTIPKGACVSIVGAPRDGWWPVKYQGKNGWAKGQLLKGPSVTAPKLPRLCGDVNGFQLTVESGWVGCQEARITATAYINALNDPEDRAYMGSGLFWGSAASDATNGWGCARNYDKTGITANAHGLLCYHGDDTFTLVSK